MIIETLFIKSDNSFKPDIIVISFCDNGSSKIETFNLTKLEAKDLYKKLIKKLQEAGEISSNIKYE